jgi:hypothetical protein
MSRGSVKQGEPTLPRRRFRIRKVGRVLTVKHPDVARLLAQDEARREKQQTATCTFSWEKPRFDTPFEQRRLQLLNVLFLAVACCGRKLEVRGYEARGSPSPSTR